MTDKIEQSSAPTHDKRDASERKPTSAPEIGKAKKRIPRNKNRRSNAGRKTKKTKECMTKLEDAFLDDLTDEEACDYAGIAPRTYYRWIAADDEFCQKMLRAQRRALTELKHSAFQQARGTKKNPDADGALAFRILQSRQRDRYATKSEIDAPTPTVPITVILPGNAPHPRFDPKLANKE
jgi:hypothetical protein